MVGTFLMTMLVQKSPSEKKTFLGEILRLGAIIPSFEVRELNKLLVM